MDEMNVRKTGLNGLSLEDSARDFEIIREILLDAGYALQLTRVDTEAAYASSLRTNTYDVILADFKLPGFDAFAALRLAGGICPDVPFICISGSIGEETAIELLKQGAVDYVLKDRIERLPFAVQRALEEAKEKKKRRRAEKSLQEKMEELERFHRLTVGRELRMIALKKEVNALLIRLGCAEKYRIVE